MERDTFSKEMDLNRKAYTYIKIHEAKCRSMVETIWPLMPKGERNRIDTVVEINYTKLLKTGDAWYFLNAAITLTQKQHPEAMWVELRLYLDSR